MKGPSEPIISFALMIEELTSLLCRCSAAREQVDGVFRIMERTLAGVDQLDLSRLTPGMSSYARHLIHRDPQNRFVVLGLVWKPGQGTPVHDHPSWGVVGVLKGQMKFVNYAFNEDPEGKRLVVSEQILGTQGAVTTVFPPECDIHRMGNPAPAGNSITLHCYGQELTEFHIYNLDTGARRVGTVSYDSEP
ncbi:MAG: cysteine dioxygenase family protein [Planctomycetota bacterium]